MAEEENENPFDQIFKHLGIEDEDRDKFREESREFYTKATKIIFDIMAEHKKISDEELEEKGEAVAILDMITEILGTLEKEVGECSPYTQRIIAHQIASTIGKGFMNFVSMCQYLSDMANITSTVSDILPDKCDVAFIIACGHNEDDKKDPSLN